MGVTFYNLFPTLVSFQCGTWIFPNRPPHVQSSIGLDAWIIWWVTRMDTHLYHIRFYIRPNSSLQNRLLRLGAATLYTPFSGLICFQCGRVFHTTSQDLEFDNWSQSYIFYHFFLWIHNIDMKYSNIRKSESF
jgi:hypothetical protein